MEIIDNWSIEERKEVVEAITEKSSDSLLLDLWLLDYSDFFDFHIFKNLCFTLSSDKQVEFLKKLFYQHKLGLFELNIELFDNNVSAIDKNETYFDANSLQEASDNFSWSVSGKELSDEKAAFNKKIKDNPGALWFIKDPKLGFEPNNYNMVKPKSKGGFNVNTIRNIVAGFQEGEGAQTKYGEAETLSKGKAKAEYNTRLGELNKEMKTTLTTGGKQRVQDSIDALTNRYNRIK